MGLQKIYLLLIETYISDIRRTKFLATLYVPPMLNLVFENLQ